MNSVVYSASNCTKGHLSLKRYNALYFLSIIVDEKAEHKTEDVVMSICQKFDVKFDNNYGTVENNLYNYFIKNKLVTCPKDLYWTSEIEGIVDIYYQYIGLKYIPESKDCEYHYKYDEYAYLVINENTIEFSDWNQDKIEAFVDDIETLFNIKPAKDYRQPGEIVRLFSLAWSRFEKGDKWATKDTMINAALRINGATNSTGKERDDAQYSGFLFIIKKWFLYLWECKDGNTPDEYIMSLKGFIQKNIESWINDKENIVITNKIYTPEHAEIKKMFANEPISFYKTLWDLT